MEPGNSPPLHKKPIPWLEIILILILVLIVFVSIHALFGETIAAWFRQLCSRYELFFCP